jgi:hypothetical protein
MGPARVHGSRADQTYESTNIASPTLEKLHASARTHLRVRVPRDSRLRRATRRRQAATNRGRSGERKTRARVVRGVPRGSGWPQTAKGGCSCLTAAPGWLAAAAARLMLNVPMPPGSACWRTGFSAAGRGGGDCDDGRSSGCRKSCVLRKKPARRACTGCGFSSEQSCRGNSVAIKTAKIRNHRETR